MRHADVPPRAASAFEEAAGSWASDADLFFGGLASLVAAAAGWAREGLTLQGGPLDDPLDPALPLFACLAWEWRDQLGSYRARHDHSKVIDRWTDVLMNIDQFPDRTDSSRMLRPLGIVPGGLDATADSALHPAVQVADLVVGAVRHWTTEQARCERTGLGEMFEAATRGWVTQAVWPDPDAVSGPSASQSS